ncbi:hypothetical protein F5I97DRAFT_1810477 [Phlebopus sp. FC_14]|nr:hypothetical protein F5I97DRAFT_1810477 [Phlebopus sp. FC_14]
MKVPDATRKYTPEEKEHLIKNLDIEVEHRVRQLEEWLAVALQNFQLHQEGLISRIPKLVRSVTMGEFADKYNGDIQACLRGIQAERMGGAEALEIDRDTRKRKWAAAQEEAEASGSGSAGHEGEPARATKTGASSLAVSALFIWLTPTFQARMMTATPKKKTTRSALPQPSPSPHKLAKPPPFVPVRGPSPSKMTNGHLRNHIQRARPPSSATFNPSMPDKAPTYPTLRAPKRDESMLSVNGSPLANPYALGLGWFTGDIDGGDDGGDEVSSQPSKGKDKGKGKEKSQDGPHQLKRVNSIVIRRDPSVVLASSSSQQSNGHTHNSHSRSNSQSTQPPSAAHSRSNSRTHPPQTDTSTTPKLNRKPLPLASVPSSSASALISLPTKDGHLLEFDPLNTSPRALDALVGITDSAKKQAREEMARLVNEAVRKWVIE